MSNNRLSSSAFDRARSFLASNDRPLEWALFRHTFESGSKEDILTALSAHQCDNGGFNGLGEGGHEGPTAMATTIAFQYLAELGIGSESVIVKRGIRFFLDSYNTEHRVWPPRPVMAKPITDRLPHAWGNPSAEIVGYLWKHRDLVPEAFLEGVTALAIQNLHASPVPVWEFADLCFLRMADYVDPVYREEIIRKVGDGLFQNLQLDHEKWMTRYFMKPYWFAMSPAQPLAAILRTEIDACLDWEIETQEPDGNFKLTWTIEGYPRKVWKSVWTCEILRVLKAYDRID